MYSPHHDPTEYMYISRPAPTQLIERPRLRPMYQFAETVAPPLHVLECNVASDSVDFTAAIIESYASAHPSATCGRTRGPTGRTGRSYGYSRTRILAGLRIAAARARRTADMPFWRFTTENQS